jgi:hypothetical protein
MSIVLDVFVKLNQHPEIDYGSPNRLKSMSWMIQHHVLGTPPRRLCSQYGDA